MNELNLQMSRGHGLLPRRRFIKQFFLGTAISTVMGGEWFATVLADCEPTTSTGGILRVKVSDFPALQTENGSVRLALNPFTDTGPSGFFYPVLVNRGSGNQFFALRAACTHMSCVVPTFGGACPCHGSVFDIDGRVLVGPAISSLTRYSVTFDGADLLCIEIPNLRYVLTSSAVESVVGPRLRLQFQTRLRVMYEVRFRPSLADAGVVVPFSTTEAGPASASVLTGNGGTATIYVDRTADTGIYSVVVQASES
jgi:Rieske Fe-S protein